MVNDGLYDPERHNVPIPDIVLGAHVVPWRSGMIGTKRGLIATSADSMRITLHGRGGHASMPARLVDPVLMAAHTIIKLQTIVSREIDPMDACVVTVASVQAGDAENIVVDDARIAVDVRADNDRTRAKALASVERIVKAESLSLRAVNEPTIQVTRDFPLTINDETITAKLEESFESHFGTSSPTPVEADGVHYNCSCEKLSGSEDFSILGTAVGKPTSFFMYGGTPHQLYDECEKAGTLQEGLPTNHNSKFAPQIQPTMRVGTDGYVVAALGWLAKQ